MLQLPLDLPNLREWGGRGRGRGNVATFRHMLQLPLNLPHLQEGGQEEGWGNAVPFRRMLQQPLNLPHLWQERRGPEGSGIIIREGRCPPPPNPLDPQSHAEAGPAPRAHAGHSGKCGTCCCWTSFCCTSPPLLPQQRGPTAHGGRWQWLGWQWAHHRREKHRQGPWQRQRQWPCHCASRRC